MPQIKMYMQATEKERKRELKEQIITSLAGARYDEKSLQKLLKELE